MARLPTSLRGKALDWGDDEAATRVQRDAASLSLIARAGPMEGHIFGTDGHPITIGRGSSCGVRLALSEISRRHATIRYLKGRYWVEDLQTLNGTRVNEQLIDGPTPLQHGDRIRISVQEFEVRLEALPNRQVVHDGPNSEALPLGQGASPSQPNRLPMPTRVLPLGPVGMGLVAVLAISTGVLLAFALTRESRRAQVRVQPSASAPVAAPSSGAPASAPAAASATRPTVPVRTRVDIEGTIALAAPEAGTVQWAAARGVPVHAGEDVVRFRRSNVAKQKELDHINEQLEDDDSNPELIRRAHALADELEQTPSVASVKTTFDGLVLASLPPKSKLQPGVGGVRVAHSVRVVLDAGAITGGGSACRVAFLDQGLVAEGRPVGGATIELTRFPAKLALESVGRVRADCP
jgi:hypothetical protein